MIVLYKMQNLFYRLEYLYIKNKYGIDNELVYDLLIRMLLNYKKHYKKYWEFPKGYDKHNALYKNNKFLLSKQQSDVILDTMILFLRLQNEENMINYVFKDDIVVMEEQLNSLDKIKQQVQKQLNSLLHMYYKQIKL